MPYSAKDFIRYSTEKDFIRYSKSYIEKHPKEIEGIVQELVERIEKGVTLWNAVDKNFALYLAQHRISDGYYCFESATFGYAGYFRTAIFSGDADFSGTTSKTDTDFSQATFKADADFSGATFEGNVDFTGAKFKGDADFSGAIFKGNTYFLGAIFVNLIKFENVVFKSQISFSDAESLNCVPEFSGIQYIITPSIEGFTIPWRPHHNNKNNIERYRQLKKIAIDGANHQQEVQFFAFETRCKIHQEKTNFFTKSLIRLYCMSSNFGQSLMRPFFCLLGILLFSLIVTGVTTQMTLSYNL